jgi:transcription elongation factor Elf1
MMWLEVISMTEDLITCPRCGEIHFNVRQPDEQTLVLVCLDCTEETHMASRSEIQAIDR